MSIKAVTNVLLSFGLAALAYYQVKKFGKDDTVKTESKAEKVESTKTEAKTESKAEKKQDEFKIPVIDVARFLSKPDEATEECKLAAELLHKYGILIIKDPRVSEKDNSEFIDMMEQYYEQPESVKAADVRAQYHYQVGTTPEFVEKARDHCSLVKSYPAEDRPESICPPEKDPKSRFFWRIGGRPTVTEFKELNAEKVIPKAFPQWERIMNNWGEKMLNGITTVAEMAAIGFGLPRKTFTDLMLNGPHLLAPTGSNLGKYNKKNTPFASFHYDLNFITIHGKSRFPGLFAWTREGKRVQVKVPDNCLLIQAGKQFEWITGGEVLAGFHEVIVCDATYPAIEKAKAENRSLWRVSSTMFGHFASDHTLHPLEKFRTEASLKKYPAIKVGKQVEEELAAIELAEKPKAQ